jgi:S1-C subfamily serine protease
MSFTLNIGGDKEIRNPTEADIRQAVFGLDTKKGDAFIVLGSTDTGMTYIQTSGDQKAGFVLEYQEETLEQHFQAVTLTPASKVVAAFQKYINKDAMWKAAFLWKRITVDEAFTGRPGAKSARKRTCGSGFFLTADGYFATNFHVVRNAASLLVPFFHENHSAKVVAADEVHDLAILKLDGAFSCLPIAITENVHLGDPVFTIGFPNPDLQGYAPKLTRGEISSLSGVRDNPSEFQISVPIQPGNSGGPLVTEAGIVVGVIVARLHDSNTFEQTGFLPQNVNYAVKSDRLIDLLRSVPGLDAKVPKPSLEGFHDGRTCVAAIRAACAQILCEMPA